MRRFDGRRRFWAGGLLVGLSLLAVSPSSTPAQSQPRPNILLILSDDHRWDALGAAGNAAIHTPVLDRLAGESVYFRQGTVHVPQCSPSRATLLTGLPPHQHGWYSNQFQRPDVQAPDGFRVPTLPGLLREAGYRTVLIGKWHARPEPWNCGFTDVRAWLPGGGSYLNPMVSRGASRERQPAAGYITEILASDAIEFLGSDAAREKPFFLLLAVTAPHLPYGPNPPHIQQLYAGRTVPELLPPGFPRDIPTNDWLHYYEAISHLDAQVGRVLAALEERKMARNTVVVFLGDNGYMMGSRGVGVTGGAGKVVPYEESVRVPFIVRAPMLAGARGVRDTPVSTLDLPSTFLALAGAAATREWVGRDLRPALQDKRHPGIAEAFCEWADNRSVEFGHLGYRLVRTPTHKLIVWERPEKPDELYDLAADPRETNNLINDPAARATRDDLRRRLRAWMEKTNDPARAWRK